MLATIVKIQQTQFAAMAQAWVATGATSFEVWEGEQHIARWPNRHSPIGPMLAVDFGEAENTHGQLRVYGVLHDWALARLQADASLIEQMLRLEGDLKSMTADLVASQDQLIAMYQLSQSLRGHVTIEETLASVVAETIRMSRVKAGFGVMLRPNGSPLVVQQPANAVSEALIWQTFWHAHANEHNLLLTAETTPEDLPEGVRNLFFTPIQIRGALNAGIGLLNKSGDGFTAPDMKLMHAVAQHASAHLENVLFYQETFEQTKLQTEVELAQRVQLQLLPQRVPNIHGLDIHAHSRPASQVGGDFYDFVNTGNRPFIFTVGDVTGKGLSAALLMTMTRSAIHSKASFMPNPTPEIVMRNSNEDLYDDFTQVGMFATAFIGQYVPEQRQMLYANAGHSPVIYRPASGRAVLLEADSTPIGVLDISLCRNHTVSLNRNDLLIIATDGFTDVRSQSSEEMFGYDRLLELVDASAGGSAKVIADTLFDRVSQFSNGRLQDDDQTLVVIKGV